jgi:cysteine-rich repeat protein
LDIPRKNLKAEKSCNFKKKMRSHHFVLALAIVLAASAGFSGADIVSFNSGGDENLIINSNPYLEGVFSKPALCGNSVVEVYEGCDDGNTNSGDGCSSACEVEPATASVLGQGGSAAGSGGVAGTAVNALDLIVTPPEISVTTIQGVEETRELTFRNAGSSTLVLILSVSGDVKDFLSLSEERFVISSNGIKTIILTIKSDSKELLTGRILVSYSDFVRVVPVIIGTKTENFLFDTSVFITDAFRKIQPGSKLTAQFNLKEINTDEKVDVVARYVIKDFDGNKYYDYSETYFVQGDREYSKEFPTQGLPEGKYVLGFDVSYPGAFAAVSSATFEVESPEVRIGYKIILWVIAGFAAVIALVWFLRNRFRERISPKHER